MGSWGARFVDREVDRAWLDLRMRMADRFAAALVDGMEPLDITTATGQTLTVTVEDDHVVVLAGDDVFSAGNVDEAAYLVFTVLYDDWQVPHPAFLDTDLIDAPSVPDNPIGDAVPTLARAESRERLQSWVEAAFRERNGGALKVAANGSIWWRTRQGRSVEVRVLNSGRIEIRSVLGRQVGFGKARKVIDDLSRRYFGLKFHLVQDRLVMSQTVIAAPFVPDQMHVALRTFCADVDRLGWVADKVLSKRAKADRAKVEAAEVAKAAAEETLAGAEQRAAAAERTAERRKVERAWARRHLDRVREERNAAQAELAGLKAILEQALGHPSELRIFGGHEGRDDVA